MCDLTALVLEHYSIGYRTARAPLAQFPRLHQRLPDCLASTRQIRALRFVWPLLLIQIRSPSLTRSSIPYDTQLSPLHKTAHETCTLKPCWSSRQKLRVPLQPPPRRVIGRPKQTGFQLTAKPSIVKSHISPEDPVQSHRRGASPSLTARADLRVLPFATQSYSPHQPREMPRSPQERGSQAGGRQQIIFAQNPPLVIVNESGRHDEASRRVVRAQAARASAAQSRITRARNRDQREGRGETQSPVEILPAAVEMLPSAVESAPESSPLRASEGPGQAPLLSWLGSTPCPAGAIGTSLAHGATALNGTGTPFRSLFQGMGTDGSRQLPLAVPRGFATLKQRVDISSEFLTLISRTACFDFGSPGVESRLHQLILDLIISSAGAALSGLAIPGHAIQGHLRIACTCLTIFQGQRADGKNFADDPKYHAGLMAAWSEVTMMDQGALTEPKTAQASIWAIMIISVTTGAGAAAKIFHQLLHTLFQDLNVQAWEHVRSILLEFIYPVSFLDEPCRRFFHGLQDLRIGLG